MDTTSGIAGERIVAAIGLVLGLTIITTILDLFGFHFLLTSKTRCFLSVSDLWWLLQSGSGGKEYSQDISGVFWVRC